jgi:3-methyl-2-oxobutanoate hydroxymethyltransferase
MSASPTKPRPVTVPDFLSARERRTRLTVLTGYDYTFARLLDESGVDAILVGDSLGMVVQGHPNALPVTLDEVIYHTRCVARGTARAMVIADLPFMTFQLGPTQALASAGRLVKEGGPTRSSWKAASGRPRRLPPSCGPTSRSWATSG